MPDIVALAKDSKVLCFDVEHDPSTHWTKEGFSIHGCGFATFTRDGVYREYVKDLRRINEIVQATFIPEIEIVAHHAQYDLHCLRESGIRWNDPEIRCTMVAANLIDENIEESGLGLKKLAPRILGIEMEDFKDASSDGLDSERFTNYALADVDAELRLYATFKPTLVSDGLWNLYTKILMPSLVCFTDIEGFGVSWDLEECRDLYTKLVVMRERLEKEVHEKIGKLDLNSGDQIANRLFGDLGYSTVGINKTKSGKRWSVDAAAMVHLAKRYAVCEKIVAYRTCDKMISTYLEPCTTQTKENKDKRIHASFWLTSKTGRLRSSGPNLQNMPTSLGGNIVHDRNLKQSFDSIRIRNAFCAPAGTKLIVADYSQIELRIGGLISSEPDLLKAYKCWKCTICGASGESDEIQHSCPKCGVEEDEYAWKKGKPAFWHGLDLHSQVLEYLPKELEMTRADGKEINFLVLYAGSAHRLKDIHPRLSMAECEEVIERIMRGRKVLAAWHQKMRRQLLMTGETRDLFGRRRRIPKAEIKQMFTHSLKQFINFPVQGSTVNLVQLCMVRYRRLLKERGLWGKVKLINMVHDEIVTECPDEHIEETIKIKREAMENSVDLGIPIRAEIKVVSKWGEAK